MSEPITEKMPLDSYLSLRHTPHEKLQARWEKAVSALLASLNISH